MNPIQRLMQEWSAGACGVTIDFVGDATLSSEMQWVIAFPTTKKQMTHFTDGVQKLRVDLERVGLEPIAVRHFSHSNNLPNGVAIEGVCPFRPGNCLGEHVIATGHGLIAGEAPNWF